MADPPSAAEAEVLVTVADEPPVNHAADAAANTAADSPGDTEAAPDEEFPTMAESRQAAHNEHPHACGCSPYCGNVDCDRILCLPSDPKHQHRWRWALAGILLLFVAGVTTLVVLLFTLKSSPTAPTDSSANAAPLPTAAPLQPKDPIIPANTTAAQPPPQSNVSAPAPPPNPYDFLPSLFPPVPQPLPHAEVPIPMPDLWSLSRRSQERVGGREWAWREYNWTEMQVQDEQARYHTCDQQEYEYMYVRPNFTTVTWRGWGTSLAWWASRAAQQPQRCVDALMTLVFNATEGLGLNMVRYVIPGGFNASLSPAIANSKSPLHAFKEGPLAPYNWSADAAQRSVLLAAQRMGVQHVDAISYSPPWWMTVSGDTAGNADGHPNILPDQRAAYAQYLVDVIEQYHSNPEWNVTFKYINPFNEALEGWWRSGRDREGCSVSVTDVDVIVALLHEELTARGLTTKIAVADSWVAYTQRSINSETEGLRKETWDKVDHISLHGYQSKHFLEPWQIGMQYGDMQVSAAAMGKEIWQTEWGPIDTFGTDLQLAMYMARTLSEHINIMGVSAWYYWMAVEGPNRVWGLIRWNWKCGEGANLTISHQYHVMKHFTRAVPPGARIISLNSKCSHGVVAAYSPENKRVAIVVTNQSFKDFVITLRLQDFIQVDASAPTLVHIRRTSVREQYALIDEMNLTVPSNVSDSSTDITINSIPVSLTTITIYGVVPDPNIDY